MAELLSRRPAFGPAPALLLLGGLVAWAAWQRSYHEVAWPDECIYLVGARNLVERGTLDTNYYLTHSILARGHPHRDVHMPGYVLALAPFVQAFGATLRAGATLNLALYLACLLLVLRIARALLRDTRQSALAAALFALAPPHPGYLFVVYPELVTSFVFLAGLAWLVSGRGVAHAAVAGLLYGAGALFRETLLVALPVYLVRIPRRDLVRGFLPGALASLLLVVAPFARDRAIHPNAIYPGVVEEARRSPDFVGTLAAALWGNVRRNLASAWAADPSARTEDAVLAFLLLLALAALASARLLEPDARRLLGATAASLGLLTAAVLSLYVVRERGGVWGGVRAYMCWVPLLLVFATPLALRPRRGPLRLALVAALLASFAVLDARQLYFFLRYKQSDHEDQTRFARYVESRMGRRRPTRIVGRLFSYGLDNYPVEVVWSPPGDARELRGLEERIWYDYLVVHERSALRPLLVRNPRYLRTNKDDKGAELLIWRRLY